MKTGVYHLVLALLALPILIICSCTTNDPDDEPGRHDARLAVVPSLLDFGTVPGGTSVDSSFSIIMVGSYYTHGVGGNVSLVLPCPDYGILSGAGTFTVNTFWDSVLVRVRCQPTSYGLKTCNVSTGVSCPLVGLTCFGTVDTCLSQPDDLFFGVANGIVREKQIDE